MPQSLPLWVRVDDPWGHKDEPGAALVFVKHGNVKGPGSNATDVEPLWVRDDP